MNRFMCVVKVLILSAYSFASFAQNYTTVDPIVVKGDNEMWDKHGLVANNKSVGKAGGSYWYTDYFTHETVGSTNSSIWCGNNQQPVPARLWNESPIADRIGTVRVYLSFNNYERDKIEFIKLLVSDTPDFTNVEEIEAELGTSKSVYYDFPITCPGENLYYKLCINTLAYQNNWIGMYTMNLYKALPIPEMPSIVEHNDPNDNGPKSFSISPVKGDLHVLASEYDKNENFIKNILPEGGEASVFDNAWENWTNKIELAEGESLVINAPENNENYIKLRAKTVSGDYHSEELITRISNRGIASQSPNILKDLYSSESVTWYTLQGVRVDHPSKGIYIKISNGKASKIYLED